MDALGPLLQQKELLGSAILCRHGRILPGSRNSTIRGRIFDERDGADSPHVAVISASLRATAGQTRTPSAHHHDFGNMDGDLRLLTIVGIVATFRVRPRRAAASRLCEICSSGRARQTP